MRSQAFVTILLVMCLLFGLVPISYAEDLTPQITVGTQEVGLTAGYLIPQPRCSHCGRFLKGIRSKTLQDGPAFMPSWMMTLTDPVGEGWFRGHLSLGAEMAYVQFEKPVLTHGVGFTPKIKYTFDSMDRIRPYVEFAGGPFWTDLGGKIPEESTQLNFILTGGFGVSYFVTKQAAINVGYRYHHISNAHTGQRNAGLNSNLPFAGFSLYF